MTSVFICTCHAKYNGENEAISIAYEIGETSLDSTHSKVCLDLFAYGKTSEKTNTPKTDELLKRFAGISENEYSTKSDYEQVGSLIELLGEKFPNSITPESFSKEKVNEKFVREYYEKGFVKWKQETEELVKDKELHDLLKELNGIVKTESVKAFIQTMESLDQYDDKIDDLVIIKSVIPGLENATEAEKVYIPAICTKLRAFDENGGYGDFNLSESDFKTEFGKKSILWALSNGFEEHKKSVEGWKKYSLGENFETYTKITCGVMFDMPKAIAILEKRCRELQQGKIFKVFYECAKEKDKYKELYNAIAGIKELRWEDELLEVSQYLHEEGTLKTNAIIRTGNVRGSNRLNGVWANCITSKDRYFVAESIIETDSMFTEKELGLYRSYRTNYLGELNDYGMLLDKDLPPEIKRKIVEHTRNGFFVIPDNVVLEWANRVAAGGYLDYFTAISNEYQEMSELLAYNYANMGNIEVKGTNYSLPHICLSEIKHNRPWLKHLLHKDLQEGGGKFEAIGNVKYSDAYSYLRLVYPVSDWKAKEKILDGFEEFKRTIKGETKRINTLKSQIERVERYYEIIKSVVGERPYYDFFLNFEGASFSNGAEGAERESCNPDAFALIALIPYNQWLIFYCDKAIEASSTAISEEEKRRNKITRAIFFEVEKNLGLAKKGKEAFREEIELRVKAALVKEKLEITENEKLRIGYIVEHYTEVSKNEKICNKILEKVKAERVFKEDVNVFDRMQTLSTAGSESAYIKIAIRKLIGDENESWENSDLGKYYKHAIETKAIELEMAKPEVDMAERVVDVFGLFGVCEKALKNTVYFNKEPHQVVEIKDQEKLGEFETDEKTRNKMYQRKTLLTKISEFANKIVKFYKEHNKLGVQPSVTSADSEALATAKNIAETYKTQNEQILDHWIVTCSFEDIGTPEFNKIKALVLKELNKK